MTRRSRTAKNRHLWSVRVRHRDYVATKRSHNVLYMKETTLWIEVNQPTSSGPSIELAIRRTNSFLNRHTREYSVFSILSVDYRGTIDN